MGMTLDELEAEVSSHVLYDSVRDALRVSSTDYDSEVYGLIAAAIHDMLIKGVSPAWLGNDIDVMPDLARQAVIVYAKAGFGYDNEEADRFMESYDSIVCTILNSSHNSVYEQRNIRLDAIVEPIDNQAYTGEAVTPEVTLTYIVAGVGITLEEDTDYTVTYDHNINVGWAVATVSGIFPYVGSFEVPFYIEDES